ncbi:MAG: sigma 54-interacting transcriptional regulator [Candidatus Zhuqueibacterota bacterium]
MKSILVTTTNQEAVETIQKCFESGYKIDYAQTLEAGEELFSKKRYEFLFIDIEILKNSKSDVDYKVQFLPFWRGTSDVDIIVLSTPQMVRDTVNAVKAGASNYLMYPLNPDEIKYIVDSLQEYSRMNSELNYLRDRFWRSEYLSVLRSNSPLMKEVFSKIRAVAPTESTVLITGETGTGKSVIAGLLHQHSKRSEKQYISVHCGGIIESLLESELFGHEKGAFTGAIRRKLGKFEIAHGGTIFLDEIGTISSSMQIALLQVLQDRTFQRVGGENVIKADVRILAATNSDLQKMVELSTFRNDLFYRLNVFPIELPRLEQRIEDIPILVENFLKRLNKANAKHINDVHPDVLEAFQCYAWPGNIRELENLIERAYILESSSILMPKSFPAELFKNGKKKSKVMAAESTLTLTQVRQREIDRVEKQYIIDLLTRHHGKINLTAKEAGIGERQLNKLMHRYGILKEDFK